MGPRFIDRGKPDSEVTIKGSEFKASMGPRFIDRGKLFHPRRLALSRPCFNGAAVHRPRKAAGSGRTGVDGIGFNGAAVHRPRKGR